MFVVAVGKKQAATHCLNNAGHSKTSRRQAKMLREGKT